MGVVFPGCWVIGNGRLGTGSIDLDGGIGGVAVSSVVLFGPNESELEAGLGGRGRVNAPGIQGLSER